MFRKILLSLTLASFVFASLVFPLANSVSAYDESDAAWYYQDFFDWYDKVYDKGNKDEIFGERYTAAQVEWINFSLFAFMINHIGNKDINWCLINAANNIEAPDGGFPSLKEMWTLLMGEIKSAEACIPAIDDVFSFFTSRLTQNTGALNLAGNIDQGAPWYAIFTNRDISTIGYVKSLGSKLHIVPEAKAQGFGYSAANVVQSLWKAVRDISYFFIVIGALYMAFLVMFRKKLSPQTAVTVQSALPKIIITLVLVTFSYAIAGFLIDLMYVSIGVLTTIFKSANLSSMDWGDLFEAFTQKSSVVLLLYYWINWIIAAFGAAFFFTGLGVGNVISLLLLFVVWLILIIVLAIVSFKLWWMLIKTYIGIILKIAFAPLMIVGGVFGFGGGFGAWTTSLAADLAVYPVTCAMIFMAGVFLAPGVPDWTGVLTGQKLMIFDINADAFGSMGGAFWDPPLTLANSATEIMFLFASLSLITMTPKVAEIIKSIIANKPFDYGSGMGEALGVGMGAYGLYNSWRDRNLQRSIAVEELAAKQESGGATGATRDAARSRASDLNRELQNRQFSRNVVDQVTGWFTNKRR